MANISDDVVRQAYVVARSVIRGERKEREGVEALSAEFGMNKASASDHIRNLRQLVNGEHFHRTLNMFATEHYMSSIANDFGMTAYENAVRSLAGHLDYYEGLPNGGARPGHRFILEKHRKNISSDSATLMLSDLEMAVAQALLLNPEERYRLLAKAPKKPGRKTATVTVFVRNAIVIAEALVRAHGRCEACHSDAPFQKKKDGKPYLEVHHKVRLADDGDDTLENAIALCPNCHRKMHYG